MNIYDLMPELKKNGSLESKIKGNTYEADYKQKHPTTPIEIQKTIYELKTEEYENLMQILKETNTELEEVKNYRFGAAFKYFGVMIENQSITRLQILSYGLSQIPYLDQLTEIKRLELYCNNITEIKGLDKLKKIENLFLFENNITEIKGIENLTQLNYLHLRDNEISIIPKEIGQLALKELDLGRNKINSENKIVQELNQNGVQVDL